MKARDLALAAISFSPQLFDYHKGNGFAYGAAFSYLH
jgi:hypothetical protein